MKFKSLTKAMCFGLGVGLVVACTGDLSAVTQDPTTGNLIVTSTDPEGVETTTVLTPEQLTAQAGNYVNPILTYDSAGNLIVSEDANGDGIPDPGSSIIANTIPVLQSAKANAGGTLAPINAGGKKANAGFEVNACDVTNVTGNLVYHDKSWVDTNGVLKKGLKAKSTLKDFKLVPSCGADLSCGTGEYVRHFTSSYRIQGDNNDGTADGTLCVCYDAGNKILGVNFNSGPFAGYINSGTISGMVFQEACE